MADALPAPTATRRPVVRSIRWRLPLLVSATLAAIFVFFLSVAYREVHDALFRVAVDRAQGAASQLADLLGSTRQRVSELRRVAADVEIRLFLERPSPDTRGPAEAALRALAAPGPQVTELWSLKEGRLITLASSPALETTYPTSLPSTGAGGRIDQSANRQIISTLAEGVPSQDGPGAVTIGYVVVRRPLSAATTPDVMNRLMGAGARLELGGRGTASWTDLTHLVPPPPIGATDSGTAVYRAPDGDSRLGALSPVAGTPWLVWVSFPTAPLDQQARGIVENMALIATLFVALAALASAAVTSRLVRPLSALTDASEAIAAGDFDRRVPSSPPDEFGRLGAAFNAMVAQIRDGQVRLVERAGQATCLAEVAAALAGAGPLADAMDRCAAALVEHVPAAHATIWTVNAADGALDRQASAGQSSPFNSGAYDRVTAGDSEVGQVAQSRSPMVTDRIAAQPDARGALWSTHPELVGVAIFPLVVNEQLVGVLAICGIAAFSDRTRESVIAIARTIAVGIARKQLEDSRVQLAGILDAASDFVTIGRPDGPPTYVNRAARRALEIPDTDRVDSLLAFRPPGFRTFFETVVLATADREGAWSGESEYISRSGKVIPVWQVSVAHRDASGRVAYLSTIARDISDQKRADVALRESEARFRQITETISEVFWMAEVGLGRFVYVSPSYERIWGRTCESLYEDPRSFLESVHATDRDRVLGTLDLQAQGQPFDHEYRIVRPDGEIRWIWDRGFPVRDAMGHTGQYVGSAQDITDRKRADERVRLLAHAVESTNEMMSVTDLNDIFTFVNRAFLGTYGYQMAEVIGQTPQMLRPDDGPAELFEEMARETRRGGWTGELPNRRKDGSQLFVSLNTSVIRDDVGETMGLLGVGRDITARRALEDQLRQSQVGSPGTELEFAL